MFTLIVQSIGSTCLGIVMGWLVRYFLFRYEKFNPKILGATVSILLGGVVIKFIGNSSQEIVFWFYPIGVFLGFIAYTIIGFRTKEEKPGITFYSSIKPEEGEENEGTKIA
jgi:hypothetical protein